MKALNAPKLRQSRDVYGLKKLNANRMKTAELMNTSSQSPYDDPGSLVICHHPIRGRHVRRGHHDRHA